MNIGFKKKSPPHARDSHYFFSSFRKPSWTIVVLTNHGVGHTTFSVFNYTEEFYRQLKRLAKHYRSLADDLNTLQHDLMENPEIGVSLGGGKRKIRLGVKSKGGGKRGGLRVITLNVVIDVTNTCINLLTIYDKKEISNVSEKYIDELIRGLK